MAGERDIKMDFALKEMEKYNNGIKFSQICKIMKEEYPEMTQGALYGFVRDLYKKHTDKIIKISAGLYILKKLDQNNFSNNQNINSNNLKSTISEEVFYQPFAEFLDGELEDCSTVIPLGGNYLGDKWGTPDVIGVFKTVRGDIVQTIEITTAEIKIETSSTALITAFGQACAYKLFSHRVYLVIPEQSGPEAIDRIDSLCILFGIGLILFDKDNPDDPKFQIKNRAQKSMPDISYLNKKIEKIADKLKLN